MAEQETKVVAHDDNLIHLAAFARRAGQWGLQLFGDELEKSNGDIAKALEKARQRFNSPEGSPPRSAMGEVFKIVDEAKASETFGVDLEEAEILDEEEMDKEKPAIKHHKVKPSPFSRD